MTLRGSPPSPPAMPTVDSKIEDQVVKDQFDRLNVALVREFNRRRQNEEASNNVVLISTGGAVYQLVVTDQGNLQTNLLYRPPDLVI